MASYRGHLAFSSVLGAAYGGVAVWHLDLNWGPALLGAAVTAVGGLLPDLDSDSGVPVRELFALAAAAAPFLLFERLRSSGFNTEQILTLLIGVYLLIRYGVSSLFKRFTVHRGMFHSIPALCIAGLVVFLCYQGPRMIRVYLAGAVMLGFLSHLVLDEIYGIDFMGKKLSLGKGAGSALKFFSSSWTATLFTYVWLALLGGLTWVDVNMPLSRDTSH